MPNKSKRKKPQQPLTPKQFDALQAEWYSKLTATGFKDAEDGSDRLKAWDSYRMPKHSNLDVRQYFLDATQFMHEYSFANPRERIIWQLHSEGLYLREVAKAVGSNKDTVAKVIKNIQKDFYVKHSGYKAISAKR